MKKTGILNRDVSALVAEMGHGDLLTVADAGLPIPVQASCIDLCLRPSLIGVQEILESIKSELYVERLILAEEIQTKSPHQLKLYESMFPGLPIEFVPHTEFKEKTKLSRGIIRSGEFTSYSSIILVGGVIY